MLNNFFDISTGFRYKKNHEEFSVHVLRRPWFGLQGTQYTPAKYSVIYIISKFTTLETPYFISSLAGFTSHRNNPGELAELNLLRRLLQ